MNHPRKEFLRELVQEAQFPDGMDIGSSYETIGIVAAGDAADWIMMNQSIAAAEAEIGNYDDFTSNGVYSIPKSIDISKQILEDNMGYILKTFEKIGNQLSIDPIGYEILNNTLYLQLNVTNHGLSDQIHDNFKLRFENRNF